MIEVFTDAIVDSHRFYASRLGQVYTVLVSLQEIWAVTVLTACLVFIIRRTLWKVPRFQFPEIDRKSRLDALFILSGITMLMVFILLMNAADYALSLQPYQHLKFDGKFLITSSTIVPLLVNLPESTLKTLSGIGWWGHNILMFGLLAYLPYSKHLHMFLSFVNIALTPAYPRGKMHSIPGIQSIIALYTGVETQGGNQSEPQRFGAKDVPDLPWKSILDAFTCTECGRCTDACPASTTGKKLSPRKIVMNVRDRAEDIIRYWLSGKDKTSLPDGSLFDYISKEELYACTTCMACVEACPVNINPLLIILEMRRYLVLDEGKAPREWTLMFSNLENNFAPWQFPVQNRINWLQTWKDHQS